MEDEVRKAVRDKLISLYVTGDGPIHSIGLKGTQTIVVYHHDEVADELRKEIEAHASPYVLEFIPENQPSMG